MRDRLTLSPSPTSYMNAEFHGLTALLVDDEAYFRRFVGQVLISRGFSRVLDASDGGEGIEICRASAPDIAILDINMPRVDGLEALKAIRQLNPDLPVVMLTSIADEMVVEKCVEAGAAYFIRKDVPANELIAELVGVIEEFLLNREPSS